MIEHRAAHGCCEEMGDEIEGEQVVSCSCTLTPVHVNGNKMHGAVSLTHLVPHLLQSNMPCLPDDSQLPISASVKQLRHAFLLLQSPKQFPIRPPAELKWAAELGIQDHDLSTHHAGSSGGEPWGRP